MILCSHLHTQRCTRKPTKINNESTKAWLQILTCAVQQHFSWLLLRQYLTAVWKVQTLCWSSVEPTPICLCSPQGSAGQTSWRRPCPGRLHGQTGNLEHRRGRGHSDRRGDEHVSPERGQHRLQQPGRRATLETSAALWLIGRGCRGDSNGRNKEMKEGFRRESTVGHRKETEYTNCSVESKFISKT